LTARWGGHFIHPGWSSSAAGGVFDDQQRQSGQHHRLSDRLRRVRRRDRHQRKLRSV